LSAAVKSIGSLFCGRQLPAICEPDNALQIKAKPELDFILCRDLNGNATAVYGQNIWDFNPYRPSARKINKINFDYVFEGEGAEQQALIDEAKYLLYCMIYFGGGGRLGVLSVSTLNQYWLVLRRAMQFCYAQRQRPMVGVLSLQQLFTVPVYLAAFIREHLSGFDKGAFSGMLRQLVRVGAERLGYTLLNPDGLDLKRPESKQHAVIPTRIYLGVINVCGDLLDQLYQNVTAYESFVAKFSDEHYGITLHNQKSLGLGGKSYYRPEMSQAVKECGLSEVFVNDFACYFKRDLQTVLLKIQYLVKTVIHLYTGMRDQEVMRMTYNCLSQQIIRDPIMDDLGFVRDKLQAVSVLSTTTKFTGYRKDEAWFAPGEVVKAIEIAQAICRGLAKIYKIEPNNACPLFLNPSILGHSRKSNEITVSRFDSKRTQLSALQALTVQEEDLIELVESDHSRDFHNEPAFAVGKAWPLTNHQLRRSLAFYASSSGFVSLPSLRAQYKHMTVQMSRYYANNFERIRTIFGYYDEREGEFVLPRNHFAFEFQMAMPMSVANQLIADLLFSEEPLFGGTGSYMQRQKKRLELNGMNIEDVRADTERRVINGEISYRSTLLGGCTKVGRCDSFLLGDYTECLSCEGAIIKFGKLKSAIEDSEYELCSYEEGSGEYQIVRSEVERLRGFYSRLIDTVDL